MKSGMKCLDLVERDPKTYLIIPMYDHFQNEKELRKAHQFWVDKRRFVSGICQLAASNSDDFSDFYFLQYFLAKLSHPDRQFRGNAPTLLLTQTDLFAGRFRHDNQTLMTQYWSRTIMTNNRCLVYQAIYSITTRQNTFLKVVHLVRLYCFQLARRIVGRQSDGC